MSITQTFHLNLIPEQGPTVVHCDQYDEGTGRLIIKLYDGDVAYTPSGTATIQGKKPDGHGFEYAATLVGNIVTADLTKQMTAVAGPVRCQVVVRESDDRTGTFVFILQVQKSALPDDTEMSASDYQLIEQAFDAVEDAEAWAVGERGGVPVDPSDETYHNNAEYWAYMASQYAQGGLVYQGSIPFASIPTMGMNDGDMYNITDDFTTDSRFIEGSGKFCPAGTNIAWVNSASKWDLLSVMKLGSLDDLNDVDVNAPSDKQVLTYDANSGEWINANAQAGAAALDDLTDVDITTPSNGQVLQYNSTSQEWENASPSTPDIDDLGDVTITSPSDGQFLKYDGNSGEWVNGSGGGGGATDLDDLTDVSISTPTNGQVLKYNSTSQEWENANESGGGASDLDDLNDVTITTPTDGQALLYDAANQIWKNGNVSGGGGMNTDGSNADSAVAFPSDSISSGKYAKSTGGFAFCDEQAATSDLTNSLQSIPANTTTETRILNIHINSYPVVNIWLESSNKVTATKDMTSDVTKTYNNATIRVHKEGNYIEVWATNTNSSSVYCHYARQSYTESNHDSLSVGKATKAIGDSSVSTGIATEATGKASYAGGYHSRTNKDYAHAEGFSTSAEGVGAFSIGSNSVAKGNFSFAQGSDTMASSANQAAFGKYNIEDTQDTYAFLIGNGTSNTRANALSLDWSGNLEVAGNVKGKFNKVTSLAVDLTGWTSDTTSQSGTTLYKKQISLNHVYVESPTVDIGSSGVLPTVAEQESYNLLQYVTCDDTVPCLYLYASAIPTTAFYINAVGVD